MNCFNNLVPPFNVEYLELGIWESYGVTDDIHIAFNWASYITLPYGFLDEDKVRIIDNNNVIL